MIHIICNVHSSPLINKLKVANVITIWDMCIMQFNLNREKIWWTMWVNKNHHWCWILKAKFHKKIFLMYHWWWMWIVLVNMSLIMCKPTYISRCPLVMLNIPFISLRMWAILFILICNFVMVLNLCKLPKFIKRFDQLTNFGGMVVINKIEQFV
jgi:hypothetical protein